MNCQSKEYNYYRAFLHYMRDGPEPDDPSRKELTDFCQKKMKENFDPLIEAIYRSLNKKDYKSIFDILDELSKPFPQITKNKVINRLDKLVKENKVERAIGMTNEEKSKKLMLYRLI